MSTKALERVGTVAVQPRLEVEERLAPRPTIVPRLARIARQEKLGTVALILFMLIVLLVFLSPVLPIPDPQVQSLADRLKAPGHVGANETRHWLGTDQLGRDVLSRALGGGRISMIVAAATMVVSGILGTVVGLVAGYRGGVFDYLVMRAVDFQMALPSLFLAILLLYIMGSSVLNLIMLLSILSWYSYTRIVRAEVLSMKSAVYVEAARSIGVSEARLLFRHIFPQVIPVLIVIAVIDFSIVMLTEASISYIGMGIQPPDTSWGRMISDGQRSITTGSWWLFVAPGGFIFLTVLSLRLGSGFIRRLLGVGTHQT